MDYCEFSCDLFNLSSETKDILTAFLAEIGFDSFYEENNKYKAYIPKENTDENTLHEAIRTQIEPVTGKLKYQLTNIEQQDWNATWEATFESVKINNDILIHTPECKLLEVVKYDITIEPQMAFGTGVHETTSQILDTLPLFNIQNKEVADCGCGTGILSILASKLGAKSIFAFDNDSFCVKNTIKNIQLNNITNITTELGKLDCLEGRKFDLVLANINKNILIQNMHYLADSVNPDGTLVLSGFFSEDVPDIVKSAESFGLQLQNSKSKNNWSITIFIRK